MTPEGKIAAAIRGRIKAMGGQVRKCSWEARAGAPDLLIMIRGSHFWIECKAPREKPRPVQNREIAIMRQVGGCSVYICDSAEAFDCILKMRGLAGE